MATSSPKKKKPRTILSFFSKSTADKELSISVQDPNNAPSTSGTENLDQMPAKTTETPKLPPSKASIKKERKFQDHWLKDYSWLEYDRVKNSMSCRLCIKHNKQNALTGLNNNFKTTTLNRHADSVDHKESVEADQLRGQLQKSVDKVMSDQESAVVVALKTAYFLAQEGMPISKHGNILDFLSELNCPHVEHLKCTKTVTYESDKAGAEMISSIASVIRKKVDCMMINSPYISFLLDESTDIATHKKLVVYAWVIDMETFTPSTHFVTNMKIESATGVAIYNELKYVMNKQSRVIPPSKVLGLGTDGAKVMTGTGKGLTGYMLRDNPMLLNYHCIAHRLALVTSQAANAVPYLVDYQNTLTGIFYFFKASANRVAKLSDIQDMLDEPNLKIKEVHEVRWLSTYIAVSTVFRTLDSLLTFFTTDTDAKSKGYAKKLIQHDFIASTYLLMDVLPVISEMCLVFQKENLDISQVKVQVDHTKSALNKLKSDEAEYSYLKQLSDEHLTLEQGKVVFKNNHIVQEKRNIETIKVKFIDQILQKLDKRFPDDDSNVIYAFSILAMRPLSFVSKADLGTWGNEKLEVLLKQYGEKKVSKPLADEPVQTCEPLINVDQAREEWTKVKNLVLQEGYPRDKMSVLWGLINQHYKQDYPNLIKLAALAVTAPIHTADCERGFSAQNATRTAARNRLSAERVDDIMTIKLEGGDRRKFDFMEALQEWRVKKRKIFE